MLDSGPQSAAISAVKQGLTEAGVARINQPNENLSHTR